ncbi:3-dehydroquinate synthase [Ferroacidibacillus organovorans]|uniref:3-dehydroquinate synthase n=1 Tax=Ferroacidibacillus organovorans TaxID=1765683 RepID=A0A117SYF4_9BACL|nr:3-dehydroquinate synthase [Ferroacidibacillus organovorans]KUO96861.1 hypothetical protein ATW55_08625 [Ferroacidibacillus organovorans]
MNPQATLRVISAGGDYDVRIGRHLLIEAGNLVRSVCPDVTSALLVVDSSLLAFTYADTVETSLIACGIPTVRTVVARGEASKSLATAETLYTHCVDAGLDRKSVILALGGGVIGDLAGFVAATYMRGVRFIQIPTTLLAHDASIGGKVAINLPQGKNLVGAFHPPRLVLYDVETLRTLPARERSSGMAEAIKHGVIRNEAFFSWLEENMENLIAGELDATEQMLYTSCAVKAEIVSEDETEQGTRAFLNFGHTVAHAIEALAYGQFAHGEAVAIGMVVESSISVSLGHCDEALIVRLRALLAAAQLPQHVPPSLDVDALIAAMRHDKKATKKQLAFVLPTRIGHVLLERDVEESVVKAALRAQIAPS